VAPLLSFRNAAVAVLLLTCSAGIAAGTEKYWIAHEAKLVIIGQFHERWTYPWADGWHVEGTLDVDEVLFGAAVPKRIEYRLICRWNVCRTWPPPPIAEWFGEKGIWFLRPLTKQTWGPPGQGGIDPGYRDIAERRAFENYIREFKR
jgi:hypothetical protein